MSTRKCLVAAVVVLGAAGAAGAQVVCIKNSPRGGPIRTRAVCKPTEAQIGTLAALQALLGALSSEDAGTTLRLAGVNLQIVSGSGTTNGTPNGRGNLVVGYNADNAGDGADTRTGSHNIVIGDDHTYTSHGGLVGGLDNTISDVGACVLTGSQNAATAAYASVTAGAQNTASGPVSAVSGGYLNTATGPNSAVSGGSANTAAGTDSTVSGGGGRSVADFQDWAAGGLFQDD